MKNPNKPLTLYLELEQPRDAVPGEFDSKTRELLLEIQTDIEVRDARLAVGPAPEGTRVGEAVTLGVLTLTFLPVVVGKLVDLLISWLARNPDQKITVVVPAGNARVTIEYNPKRSNREGIRRLVIEAVELAQLGKNPKGK
jgi:hypothetical protein